MRWIEEFELTEAPFGSGAGLGPVTSKALRVGETTLVNAVDFADFSSEPVQMIVCDYCATPGCGSGRYAVIRRLDDYVVVLPAFSAMLEGEWELTEYSPPDYLEHDGALVFPGAVYVDLCAAVPRFQPSERLAPLTRREAVYLVQHVAPRHALGRFPAPQRVDADAFLASSTGDLAGDLDTLAKALAMASASGEPATIATPADSTTLFLDAPEYLEWSPFARAASGELLLRLDDRIAVGAGGDSVRNVV